LIPGVVTYFFGFLIMGWLALDAGTQAVASRHIPISPAPHSIRPPVLQAGRDLHSVVWHYLTHEPESCSDRGAHAVNDYQRTQCKEYWSRLETLGWIASLPFVLAGIVLFVLIDGVRLRYRRARKRISAGKSIGRGIVTDPPESPADALSWWTGTQPITVQGAVGRQMTVYLPPEMPLPAPGTQVTLYEWGKFGGKPVHFAVLYAPHLAVLQGG